MDVSISDTGQVELAQRFEALHQLLYARGGIRPTNAAVEEVSKLLLLRIAADRHPDMLIGHHGRLSDVLTPERVLSVTDAQPVKDAFARVNELPDFGGRVPGDGVQPVWPLDEPLRISRSDIVAEALSILRTIPLGAGRTIDVLGTAFDAFLRGRYDHAGGLGTYLTPHSVVQAMVDVGFELVDPVADWDGNSPVMGDPCCGSGRFLVGMLERARQERGAGPARTIHDAIVGADQSAASVAMARVNLLAYGLPPSDVFVVQDSITNAALDRLRGSLRLILTNPPFGDGKYDSRDGISRAAFVLPGLAGKSRIDPALAFVARCVDLLAPEGVAGIILPDGVVDGAHVRDLVLGSQRLIDSVRVEGVLSLPSETFTPAGTMAKTSVLFVRKSCDVGGRVFFARADHVGHVMKKGTVTVDPEGDDLPELSRAICQVITGSKMPKNTRGMITTLEPGVVSSLDASSIDGDALRARRSLVRAGGITFGNILLAPRKHRTAVADDVPFISVLHVDELGNVDWLQARDYRPTTPGVVARCGQIVISLLNPAKFRATVVPEAYPVVQCSAEFGVFDALIDPYAALALLQHPLVRAQIAPLGRGTSSSRRRIESDDVLGLVAPPHDEDWVGKTGRLVAEALAAAAEARSRLQAAYASAHC